ncbi:hypothetical protein PTKIN_Ptkin04bG0063800 [Pterospermum kingtungense]
MAMLGMQADMQHKRPFSGCYTAWDLNLDANGTVLPPDNVDRILRNRQYDNGTLPLSSENMFFYKDLLTQTMLKHEAEFRDQIRELHRLYRRQKELMDEMKKNDLFKHHHRLETLQPNHVLSPESSNYVQVQTSASTSLLHCQPPISEAKGSILPLHSYDGNREQAGLNPSCIESSSRASEFMVSNCKKFGKKILDLELPADEYDSEEEGFSEVKIAPEVTDIPAKVLEKIPKVRDGGDKELFLGGSGCNSVFSEGNFISSSNSSKIKVMADLNIPAKLEEDIIPEFSDFQDPVMGHKETLLQDPFGKSNSNFQVQFEEVKSNSQIMKDPEAHLEISLLDEHNTQREHMPSNDKAGQGGDDMNSFAQDLYTEKSSTENIDNEQAHDCAIPHCLDETDGKPCSENLHPIASNVSADNHIPVATSDMFSSHQIVPLADTMKSESSSVSSWRRAFQRSPIVVQALPCFKGKSSKSSTVSSGLTGDELCLGKNLSSSPKLCSATFLQASLHNDFQLEDQPPCTSSVSPNCNNDNDFADEHSPVKYTKDFKYVRTVKSLDLNFALPGFSTDVAGSQDASHTHGAKEDIKDQAKDEIPDINLEFDHVPARGKELAKTEVVAESEPYEKYPACGVIDLNCCLFMDESLLMPSASIEMNVEPPASPDNEECSPPRGESDETQLETPLLSSGQEDGDPQEELVRNAVEAIVSISSSEIQTCLDSTICEPSKTSNSLYWFARVASSVVDDPGSEFGVNIGVKDYGDHDDYLSDGIDYFEAMTLNLPEMKVEESRCRSNGQKEEELSAIFLTNQPKRGRTRRGRQQRKDFQSEILPSLASLSRYEVTEDLQMIGGLMEAAGARWETGSSRNAGRYGYMKGRRRSSARASNVAESTVNMLLKPQQSVDGIRQRKLIEWGKITRRPRGPRCPSSNPRLILGQV